MHDTTAVDRGKETALQVVSTKYPADRVHLLEAVQKRRGDRFVSETVRAALDAFIDEHFPGVLQSDPILSAGRREVAKTERRTG